VRNITGALSGSLKIPVGTSLPCHVTSLGNPTFTDKIFMNSTHYIIQQGGFYLETMNPG
jgi:hypothetical protein